MAICTDSAVHPETRIKPSTFSEVSPFWPRKVNATDLVHYTVAEHKVLPGEDCYTFPPQCPVETIAMEQTGLDAPKAMAT
jgi:hypothetical protein